MCLTVTVPDAIAEHARALAALASQSVSAAVAEAVERHVAEARRRHVFDTIDALVGTGSVRPGAGSELRAMRDASDRALGAVWVKTTAPTPAPALEFDTASSFASSRATTARVPSARTSAPGVPRASFPA